MHAARNLDARALDALYDEGYYHGENSGYPAAGYESEHASWRHWVDFLGATHRGAWLDLGCAYGFLVAEARAGGFQAVGVDVSAYALSRASVDAPAASGRLTRSCIEALPFADQTFAVVSAFDVLEHLVDPDAALAEVRRVLRPGGALVGATPDPLRFDRQEETHFSEYPPSFWVERLVALGFTVDFRFFQAAYNLELYAVRADGPRVAAAGALRPEGLGVTDEIGTAAGPAAARIGVRLRDGFGTAEPHERPPARWLEAGRASVYVVVTGDEPVALAASVTVRNAAAPAEITVALDDQRLAAVTVGGDWREIGCASTPAAAGGHHLRIETSAPLFVRGLVVRAEPVQRNALLARLPFDMYQRYDQVRAIVAALPAPPRSWLDVGGALGGPGGHLAVTKDFFPDGEVRTIDARALDHPAHRAASGVALPFEDDSVDAVLCLDVLEHVPPLERTALLGELTRVARRWLFLAAPFATPGVAAADAALFALIEARHGYAHQFLAEHLGHGHPDLTTTSAFFRAAGASVVAVPNGYLPYWTLMQTLNLQLAEPVMGPRYAAAQACYNGVVPDWHEPAYRHLVVIDLAGDAGWCHAVRRLGARALAPDVAAGALNRVLDLVASRAPVSPAPDARPAEAERRTPSATSWHGLYAHARALARRLVRGE